MSEFNDLILKHRGKVFCIIGGAPFDPELLDGIKADVFISANAHGVKLRECDYMVAMDSAHTSEGVDMVDYLRQFSDAPIIGPYREADYQMSTWPDYPRISFLSGMAAVWCAWAMGAKAVLLVGMNAYDGTSLKDSRIVKDAISVPVRTLEGGALSEVFPPYDPKEKWGHYKESPLIRGLINVDAKITVRVIKPTGISGRDYQKGEEIRVMRHEVRSQLKHKMVVEV